MSYPYNLFKTRKNISIEKLRDMYNVFNNRTGEESILEKYKLEINDYIKSIKINNEELGKIKILKKFSEDSFDQCLLNNNNIDLFCKKFIYFKDIINKNKLNINNYFINSSKMTNIIRNKYNKNLRYNNPINFKYIEYGALDKELLNKNIKLNTNLYIDYSNEISITLDTLLQGDVINVSLPCVGIISPIISQQNTLNYVDFINKIINCKEGSYNITNDIPFISLNIGEQLATILLSISENKFENENYEYNNNTELKNLIKNMIKRIDIKMEDIFMQKNTNKKSTFSKSKKLKNDYIIPYDFDKDNKIIKISKSKLDSFTEYTKVIEHNNKLIKYIIKELYYSVKTNQIYTIELTNYKNVLACYLFNVIRLVYDICKEYLNKIDNILKNISSSKEKRFGYLNLSDAFEYIILLNKSLYKFKLILLNNFYNLFLPSKIDNGSYGMQKDEYNCFIPEKDSIFLNNNDEILNKYPFQKIMDIENITSNFYNTNDKLKDFILTIYNKIDIYDKNYILEFGGFCFNLEVMKKSNKILNNYFKLLQKTNLLNLYIIDKLFDNFKKNIPYELLSNIEDFKDIMKEINLKNTTREEVERKLSNIFEFNIEKSTKNYIKVLDINKKIEFLKKENIHNLYNLKDIYYLIFIIYYIKSISIMKISEYNIQDLKLKNSLIKKYMKIKEKYEIIIKNYIDNSK